MRFVVQMLDVGTAGQALCLENSYLRVQGHDRHGQADGRRSSP